MALRPIDILKDVIAGIAHTITIDSVESLGGSLYKLNTENTIYLRELKKVTIGAVDYKVTDFVINSYVTVQALSGDIAVTARRFTIDVPLFLWGNPKMVSAELDLRIKNKNADGTQVHPYLWLVEVGSSEHSLNPSDAVKVKPTFNIFFLDSNKYDDWTIEDHYTNAIDTMSNYIDYVIEILKSRRDLFDTDSIVYNTVNHVNFGDYIVDKGMEERILNDNVTGVQLQITIPYTIDTCNDIVITTNCEPVTILVDGVFDQLKQQGTTYDCITSGDSVDVDFNSVPTGVDAPCGQSLGIGVFATSNVPIGTLFLNTANLKGIRIDDYQTFMNGVLLADTSVEKDKLFSIVDGDDNPVVVTTVIDTETIFKGSIVIPTVLNTANLAKTGQTATFRTGDDGDLKEGRLTDWWNLGYNNGFGENDKRFTGTTGGYQDEIDTLYYDVDGVLTTEALAFPDDLMIDWRNWSPVLTTVPMWWRIATTISTWEGAIDAANASTEGGFSDWYLPNVMELLTTYNWGWDGGGNPIDWKYEPFNLD